MRLDGLDSTSVIMIHIARSQLPGFVLIVKSIRGPGNEELGKSLPSSQSAFNRHTTNLLNSPPSILTNDKLRKLVLGIFASELGLELHEIFETLTLGELGIDSLMSISISDRLREELGAQFKSDLLFGSKTIKDVLNKLRFATRPYFKLCGNSGGETQFFPPQISLYEPLFAVMETASDTSLFDHLTTNSCLDTVQNMFRDPRATFTVADGLTLSVSLDIYGIRNCLRLCFSRTA
jgi:acyl carrier protein